MMVSKVNTCYTVKVGRWQVTGERLLYDRLKFTVQCVTDMKCVRLRFTVLQFKMRLRFTALRFNVADIKRIRLRFTMLWFNVRLRLIITDMINGRL